MATLLKRKRLFNPSRKRKRNASSKRKLSLKQKLFFGSKKQRVAAKASLRGKKKAKANPRKRRRVKNIGQIFTIKLKKNPASKMRRKRTRKINSMVKSRKRVLAGKKAARTRKRRHHMNPRRKRRTVRVSRRRRNPSRRSYSRRRRNPGVVVRYRSRKRNPSRRSHHRRKRNPGMSGAVAKALGFTAGFVATKFLNGIVANMSPSLAGGGLMGAGLSAALAVAEGFIVKKVLKKASLGEDIMIGGLVYAALQLLGTFAPNLGLSGLGIIGNSSFYVPQVPQPGSMGKFMVPPAVSGAIAAAIPPPRQGMNGIYPTASGGNRLSLRRVGRSS